MLLYIAVRCGFKLPIMPHYACYMRRIIALPIFHCSANLLCFSNIKCSIKQPLPRVLSLIAPILKFLTTMHSLTKLPFVFFRAFINFCILPLSILKVSTTFCFSQIFFINGVGVCDFEPRLSNFVFALFALFPFGGWLANFFFHFLWSSLSRRPFVVLVYFDTSLRLQTYDFSQFEFLKAYSFIFCYT